MSQVRSKRLLLIAFLLLFLVSALPAEGLAPIERTNQLPASEWWLVVHNQCDDTLHWINQAGEYASIARPTIPNEAPVAPCSYRALHISQDGRYLVQTATLTSGASAVGFYDLQTGTQLGVYEAVANEVAHLGDRYSSDRNNQIAVSFTTQLAGVTGWRVVLFDMPTGSEVYELRSDGAEIASFVGGEFLATTPTSPQVLLLGEDPTTHNEVVMIRFDRTGAGGDPFGAVAWYPLGAPGVGQALISSPYTKLDVDILPTGHAIQAYTDPAYPPGPPIGAGPFPTTSNAVGLLRPPSLGEYATSELFFADGISTMYKPQWGADGRIALFRRSDGTTDQLYWIKLGTAVLTPMAQQIAQVLGVPNGFVFSTADGIYYLNETTASPTGPVFTDPALSGSMAFVWATAYGNPPLALDTPHGSSAGGSPPMIVTATPDLSNCRIRSADGSTINVRTGPSTDYAVLGQASGSMELTVVGYNGQWYAVNFSGTQGWMAGWVSTLLGNCGGLTFINAPAAPPTAPPAPTAVPGASGPDLYVSEFALDPATPVQGQPVSVRVGVYNRGTAAATGTFHISWFAGENYPSPACDWDLDGLVATGGRILTCTYAGYPSWYGSINTLVVVDTTNAISETDESNNRYTRSISVSQTGGGGGSAGQPDLYVSEFALDPATPVQGQSVNVRVGVYNRGTAAASGTFHISWFAGENYPSPACSWDLTGMAASGGRILTCTYAGYPSWYAAINTLVVVDTGNTITESDESNNRYTRSISVMQPSSGGGSTGQPDLYVSEFALDPATPVQGQPVSVRVGVYNRGTAAVSGTNFHISWFAGENYPSPACGWDLDSMAAHGGRILTCTYAGYPSWYGAINTKVIVDTGNTVSESDESNNSYSESISVSKP